MRRAIDTAPGRKDDGDSEKQSTRIEELIKHAASMLKKRSAERTEAESDLDGTELADILKEIGSAVQNLPPAMRDYSKWMHARPVAEGAKIVAETGLIGLIATNVLQTAGIAVTPGSLTHIATLIVAGGGVGVTNAVTEANLLKWFGSKEWGSLLENGMRAGGVALLLSTTPATIAVVQDTIDKTQRSERAAGGIVDPLDRFAEKQRQFKEHLRAFSRVPGEILEIARKIEEGKRTDARKTTRSGEQNVYVPWSEAEKRGFVNDLRNLFGEAGLDPALAERLVFNQPKELGHGIAAKFKQALYMGDTKDLPPLSAYPAQTRERLQKLAGTHATTEEYVLAVREKMGLSSSMSVERKMQEIINDFMAAPVFAEIGAHQEIALRQARRIREQGEDYVNTFKRSLEGVAPIDPEIMMPHVRSIIDARVGIEKTAQEKLIGPIARLFATMGEALKVAGASVETVNPSVTLDVSDMEQLAQFISSLAEEQSTAAPNEAAARSAHSLLERFVPGGKKWEHTKQWFTVQLARWSGYHVELVGPDIHVYERNRQIASAHEEKPPVKDEANASMLEKFFGTVRSQTPAEIDSMSDADLGKLALDVAAKQGKLIVAEGQQHAKTAVTEQPWDPAELGKEVRMWIADERNLSEGHSPITLKPDAWNLILHGTLPPDTERFDKSQWRELPREKAEEVLRSYEPEAKFLGGGVLSGVIGGTILGVLLGSIPAVRRLNNLLNKAAPDYEEKLLKAEIDIVKNLQRSLNDVLRILPVFNTIPPMGFSTLHAALRLAAEETYPAALAEAPAAKAHAWHALKEAARPGPFASSVEEIKSFRHFLELLATSPAMQEHFADIIAPGISQAQRLALKDAILKAEDGDPAGIFAQLQTMPPEASRVFRDAARGHVRLRIAVVRAEHEILTRMLDEIKDGKEKGIVKRRSVIQGELQRLKEFDAKHSELLSKLDREDIAERAASTTRRMAANPKSEREFNFVVPRHEPPVKRFAASDIFDDDVRHRIELIIRTGGYPEAR